MVLDAHQRFREINLQRVRAPIARDEFGADVGRHEEHKEALGSEIAAERRRRYRKKRPRRADGEIGPDVKAHQ